MAGFRKMKLSEEEKRVAHLEIKDLSLNVTKELVGHGSSASVYKYLLRGKMAAAKQFKAPLSRKSMARAASTILKLNNENVCRLRGLSYRPPALLFEYCCVDFDGQTVNNLRELLSLFNDNEYYNFAERVDLSMQVAKGVNYLHHNGVIHRDLKPSNILVSGSQSNITLKIADFNEVCTFKTLATVTASDANLKGKMTSTLY